MVRPLLNGSGTRPLLAFLLGVLLVDLPLLLGIVLTDGWRQGVSGMVQAGRTRQDGPHVFANASVRAMPLLVVLAV